MRWTLALLSAATALLMGGVAVRDHAAVVRAGYAVSELERRREGLATRSAHTRARLSRLCSPAALADRGRELGLVTEYPGEHAVEKVGPRRQVGEAVVARNE